MQAILDLRHGRILDLEDIDLGPRKLCIALIFRYYKLCIVYHELCKMRILLEVYAKLL